MDADRTLLDPSFRGDGGIYRWAQPRKGGIFDMLRPYGQKLDSGFRRNDGTRQAWTTAAHEMSRP